MAQANLDHVLQLIGWNAFASRHMPVVELFLFYTVPLSVLPPAMIYYAGITYGGHLLPALSIAQLENIGIVFYLTELAMTFVIAYFIQRLGEWVGIEPAFEDAYKLAIVVPAPLWVAPLFLFIPSFTLNLTTGAAALILSGMLIFYGTAPVLKIEDKGRAILLSGSILAAGMVAWAAMMYLTLLFWGYSTSF